MKLAGIATLFVGAASLWSGPLLAESSQDWEWFAAQPANKQFSVEVPCSPEVMATDPRIANVRRSMGLDEGSSVVCLHEGVPMMAGVVSGEAAEGVEINLFDRILEDSSAVEKEGLDRSAAMISGRRASISREIVNGTLLRTAMIEMGPTSVLTVVMGGSMEGGVPLEEVGPILDRYFASLEFAS